MKPIIIENSKVPKIISLMTDIGAITLWPFIFIKDTANERLIRHESIHIAQYNELFVIGFLALYLYDWIHGLLKYRDSDLAYYQTRFEQEAYEHSVNNGYLESRNNYEWMKYHV